MSTADEDRLIALEIRSTEQELIITELSDQIAQQWQVIDRLQKKFSVLAERFLALEEQATPAAPVTKPPHW